MVLSGEFGAEAYDNQFIDLEAQDSDEEYFSERDDTEYDSEFIDKVDKDDDHGMSMPKILHLQLTSSTTNAIPATSKPSNISSSPSRTTRLNALFEHLEARYVNVAGDFSAPSDVADQLSNRVWLQGQDWPLWRVKCTVCFPTVLCDIDSQQRAFSLGKNTFLFMNL